MLRTSQKRLGNCPFETNPAEETETSLIGRRDEDVDDTREDANANAAPTEGTERDEDPQPPVDTESERPDGLAERVGTSAETGEEAQEENCNKQLKTTLTTTLKCL